MHRLIYISKSLIGTDRSDLDAIVETSAVRNACAGITGVLWFDTNNFAQVLEGDRAAIIETMCRINADERHTDVEIICDREIKQPMFGNWSMTLPRETPEGIEATAFLIGFAQNEQSASARKLYEIAIAADDLG